MLLGCAYFHDLLKSPSVLCKELQADEVCIVTAIEALLKTVKSMEKVRATSFENLATVKVVLTRIKHENNACTYQGADLKEFDEAVTFLKITLVILSLFRPALEIAWLHRRLICSTSLDHSGHARVGKGYQYFISALFCY